MLSTLDKLPLPLLTEGWNRCWQGYYYDMHYEQEHMKAWLTLAHINLSYSMGLFAQNKLIGLSLLSLDNEEGWIAGTCIDPEYRGQKLFAPLMAGQIRLAQALGLKRLFLEVFTQNHAAVKVYENAGFKKIRPLRIFRFPSGQLPLLPERPIFGSAHSYLSATLELYFQTRSRASFKPAWQRREAFLLGYPGLSAFLSKNKTSGYLIGGKQSLLLDAWTSSVLETPQVVADIMDKSSFSLNNQPDDDPLCRYLTKRGIVPADTQWEMVLSMI